MLFTVLAAAGLGPLPCVSLATLLAAGLVVWLDRRRARRLAAADAPGPAPAARKRPMTPLAAAAYTLGGVVVFAYVIFIIVTAAKG